MSNSTEESSSVYVIPQNYEDRAITAGGRSLRNVAEGAVMASFTIPIFIFLPTSLMYRAILIAAIGGALFAFGLIGIKQCCVSEYVLKVIQFRKSVKVIERNDDDIFDSLLSQEQLVEQSEVKEAVGQDVENQSADASQNLLEGRTEDAFSDQMQNNASGKKKRKNSKKKRK